MATIIQTAADTYTADNGRGTSLTIIKKSGGPAAGSQLPPQRRGGTHLAGGQDCGVAQ